MGSLQDEMHRSLVLKDIRPGTRRSYVSSLRPFFHLDLDALTVVDLNEVLYAIPNQNTRRKTIIALKSLVAHPAVRALRVPEPTSRVYDLPDETTLRLALMTCTHETRALLMAYAGLRCGEACAVTGHDLDGRWLVIDEQVDETTRKVVPGKTNAARVPLPSWLVPLVASLDTEVYQLELDGGAMRQWGMRLSRTSLVGLVVLLLLMTALVVVRMTADEQPTAEPLSRAPTPSPTASAMLSPLPPPPGPGDTRAPGQVAPTYGCPNAGDGGVAARPYVVPSPQPMPLAPLVPMACPAGDAR